MADTIVISDTLKITCGFVDSDTRMITQKNPRNDISSTDIEELNSWMQVNQPIVGDKWSGAFGKITEAKKVRTTRNVLDLRTS